MHFHRWNPFYARELLPSGRFFRKCMRNTLSFQIKRAGISFNSLIFSQLHFRKGKTCLNNFLYLRKSYFSYSLKRLIMNTLSHRAKILIFCFFANVGIKSVKRNICEKKPSASKYKKSFNGFILKHMWKILFSQMIY